MNDIRRTILWVIFSFALVMLWDRWQIFNGKPATFGLGGTTQISSKDKGLGDNTKNGASNLVHAEPGGGVASAIHSDTVSTAVQLYELETDVLKLKFSSRGASLVYAELLGHKDSENIEKNVVLLDDRKGYEYVAQTGLIGTTDQNLPNHQTTMLLASQQTKLSEGQNELVIRFVSAPGADVEYTQIWTFKRGEYAAQVKHEVKNISSTPISPSVYVKLLRDSNKPAGESSFYFTYTGPVAYTDEIKYKKVDFSDIEDKKVQLPQSSKDGYVAMAQHYFVSSWVFPLSQIRSFFTQQEGHLYSIGMQAPFGEIAPQNAAVIESTLFVGPQLEKVLEKITPGLELVKDYGWFTIFSKPLYWLLFELHKLIGNWGWAIIALVVLLKAALYWLNAKAYTSMAKMKSVAPRITEMRERLKDNPMQMQQEMLKIYKEEKVNPMGGCLPMLVQIPVFIALYWVLLSSVEMRGAPWELWIKDLSIPDPYFILPIIMTATTVLQTWLNPKPADPMQEKLMWFMPLAFSVMFFFFPAGLVLYWITNNVLTIAQQWFINKRMGVLK